MLTSLCEDALLSSLTLSQLATDNGSQM